MSKFLIKYGLGGSFSAEQNEWEEIDVSSFAEAEEYAYEEACQEYETYEGMYGLRTVEEIMEDEDCDEDMALALYLEERESWLYYEVKEVE